MSSANENFKFNTTWMTVKKFIKLPQLYFLFIFRILFRYLLDKKNKEKFFFS